MIIVTKPDATEEQIQHIVDRIKEWGLKAEVSRGAVRVVIGVIGPEELIREKPLAAIAGVESVTPVLKPYKLVAHEFRQTESKVKIGEVTVGNGEVVIMSGPCSVDPAHSVHARCLPSPIARRPIFTGCSHPAIAPRLRFVWG